MRSALRNFTQLLRHYKSASVINILGLSAALMVFFTAMIQVNFDLTFDRSYDNGGDIYQLALFRKGQPNGVGTMNAQVCQTLEDMLPEVEAACLLSLPYEMNATAIAGNDNEADNSENLHPVHVTMATPGFLDIFTPEIVAGNAAEVFSGPGAAMISEATAERIFGEADPIGQVILTTEDGVPEPMQYIVAAVYRDFPRNTTFATNGLNSIFTLIQIDNPAENWGYFSFMLIKPENLNKVREQLEAPEVRELFTGFRFAVSGGEILPEDRELRLTELRDLYITGINWMESHSRIGTTIALFVIAVLTLIIALVNFINLSLAMAPERVRSINIRRVLGQERISIRTSMAMESVFFSLIAIVMALSVIYLFRGNAAVNDILPSGLSFSGSVPLIVSSSVILLVVALGVGLYTSKYSTSFEQWEALKGSFALEIKGKRLRNILIVFQFATAIVLICVSWMIQLQHRYMSGYDWGFPRENVVFVPTQGLSADYNVFGEELMRDPMIINYSGSLSLPGEVGMSWGGSLGGKDFFTFVWSVDGRFLDLFDMDMVAGAKPSGVDSTRIRMVVNEAFVKTFDYDETILGQEFMLFAPICIEGIAKNVNFEPLHSEIRPLAFALMPGTDEEYQYMIIKYSSDNPKEVMDYIAETWRKFSTKPADIHFLNEKMDQHYQREKNLARLLGVFGLIIVVIAVMGVYGLIIFNTRSKRKEIGIRKVNGSSSAEIVLMLNRNMLILLAIAFVIAVPVAWYLITKWLEGYAYKASVPWWLFPAGGLLVLIISVIAVSWQSLKAANTNPAEVIKNE